VKRNFNVVIELHGNAYVARCPEFPDLLARGSSKSEVLETLKALIRKKLDDSSDSGSAPRPQRVPPSPRGPFTAATSVEKPKN